MNMRFSYLGVLLIPISALLTSVSADDFFECADEQTRVSNVNLVIKRNFMHSPTELVIELRDRSEHYIIEATSDVYYKARDAAQRSSDAVNTLELNRISGKLILTNRISKAALPVLVDRCNDRVSDDQCVERMKAIEHGNVFACFDPKGSGKLCDLWQHGSNIVSEFEYHCRAVERRF